MWPIEPFVEEPPRHLDRLDRFGLMHNNMDRWMDHGVMPYWRDADHSMLHVGNTKEVVNDEKKFHGRDLIIEGHQEVKTEHGYIKKAFTHKWALPEECDLDAANISLYIGSTFA
ncbi:unnamed protein product [Heligmosomoides polygyrus]|uniref:SHSP domain-containing protein n=1 Tax=Heligmosomoides polygyrus TaxID=6339 RepID=A0A183GG63_HELPZ|nr:unnamed protein product [Heligmosomoides polygyrus]